MMEASPQEQWRNKWLDINKRPLNLAYLTCGTCGYVPDWLEPVGGASPYLAHAQDVNRDQQQSQLLFHLKSRNHAM